MNCCDDSKEDNSIIFQILMRDFLSFYIYFYKFDKNDTVYFSCHQILKIFFIGFEEFYILKTDFEPLQISSIDSLLSFKIIPKTYRIWTMISLRENLCLRVLKSYCLYVQTKHHFRYSNNDLLCLRMHQIHLGFLIKPIKKI